MTLDATVWVYWPYLGDRGVHSWEIRPACLDRLVWSPKLLCTLDALGDTP